MPEPLQMPIDEAVIGPVPALVDRRMPKDVAHQEDVANGRSQPDDDQFVVTEWPHRLVASQEPGPSANACIWL